MTSTLSIRSWRLANAVHRATGIPRALDPKLCAIARQRAIESMTVPGHPAHIYAIEQAGHGWGEVLGWRRFDVSPIPEIVQGWLDSPTHETIIRDPSYHAIGASVYYGPDSKWYLCVIVSTGVLS